MSIQHAGRAMSGHIARNALGNISRTRTVPAQFFAAMEGSNGSTTITDQGRFGLTQTCVGSAAISTDRSRYGSTSLKLINSGDYVLIDQGNDNYGNGEFAFGADDWTVECYVYLLSLPASGQRETITVNCTVSGSNNGFAGIRLPINSNGSMYALIAGSTATTWNSASNITASSLVGTGAWTHIACTRASGVHRLFINGTVRLTITNTAALFDHQGEQMIGACKALGSYVNTGLNGYIDQVRITRGVAAYTANFTPGFYDQNLTGTLTNGVYGSRQIF